MGIERESRYGQAIGWLYSTQKTGIKLGLENTRRLLELVGNPHLGMRCFHVAGTNGKGSVCAMLDGALRACGYRTGLFTSPHLIRFGERIQVDGVPIPDERLAELIERVRGLSEELTPTFFEITTAIAMLYFREANVDVAVLETGMGGRLDSTNVVTPLAAIITAIDLDHTQWLGATLREIAAEKAGIIKAGIPVISVPQQAEAEEVLNAQAAMLGSPIEYVSPLAFELVLKGSHQRINAAAALRALEVSGLPMKRQRAEAGLRHAVWPGRFDEIAPGWILDGAHNPAAIKRLIMTWHEVYGELRPTVVFGALRDKDVRGMLARLSDIASRLIVCPVQSDRALAVEELSKLALDQNLCVEKASSVEQAMELAKADSRVLITGSLFLAGEVLAFFKSGQMERSLQ